MAQRGQGRSMLTTHFFQVLWKCRHSYPRLHFPVGLYIRHPRRLGGSRTLNRMPRKSPQFYFKKKQLKGPTKILCIKRSSKTNKHRWWCIVDIYVDGNKNFMMFQGPGLYKIDRKKTSYLKLLQIFMIFNSWRSDYLE